MKRTLLIGLMTSTLLLGQAGAVKANAITVPSYIYPTSSTSVFSTESVFGRSSKPVKETFVEEFDYIYPTVVLPRHAQFIEDVARQHKANMEEKARQEEEQRKLEEQRIELARKDNVQFNTMDVTQKSGLTASELESILYNVTNGSGLAPYASYFIEAEEMYSINALFLCGLAAEESGWGRYAGGNGTNITGYAVYTSSHSGKTFEGGIRDNILSTAELLATHYTSPNGKYKTVWDGYNDGKSIYEVNQRYCFMQDQKTVDNNWARKISSIAKNLEKTYHSVVK